MNNVKKYFRIFKYQFELALMINSAYRINFVLLLIQSIINTALSVVSIGFIYGNINQIAGWNVSEMIILVCTSLVVNQLYRGLVLQGQNFFLKSVVNGDFDKMLLKPINIPYQINIGKFDLVSLCSSIAPIIVIIYKIMEMKITLRLYNVFFYIITVISGVVIISSFMLIVYSMAFKYIKADSLMEIYYIIMSMSEKPKEILRKKYLKFIFCYIIPVIPIANISVEILLNKLDVSWWIVSVLIGIILNRCSILLVNSQLKKYSSASN